MKKIGKLFLTVMLFGVATFATSQSASAACNIGNCWGAVAMNPGSGAWAYSYNYPSRASARASALQRCGGRCTRVLTFHNSCGAYAVGYNGWGWGSSRNRESAQSRALYECRRRTGGCRVRVWACTSR